VTYSRTDPTDPMITQLHLQAAGVQNIRPLFVVLLQALAGPGPPHPPPLHPRRSRPRPSLKQTPRTWYYHFDTFLMTLAFREAKSAALC
jgi:hypothetical protein